MGLNEIIPRLPPFLRGLLIVAYKLKKISKIIAYMIFSSPRDIYIELDLPHPYRLDVKKDKSAVDGLLFRRQFILGPYFVEKFNAWKKIKINDYLFLTCHPDLGVYQATHENKKLILLGYVLDPFNSKLNDLDILQDLACKVGSADDLFKYTDSLGGRWVIIFTDGKVARLFNDAGGLRQVFYTNNLCGELWCASQPGLIAEELGLDVDKDALDNFISSPFFKNYTEYWWPADSSPFKEIDHLLPNHYLDLKERGSCRYWPNEKVGYTSLEEGINESSRILRGLMESASRRFDLSLAITAGWDSRLLLAASKEIREHIFYYIRKYGTITRERTVRADINIPARLLSRLGLKHNIVKCPTYMGIKFKEIYKKNVVYAHDKWGNMVQGLYRSYPQDRISVFGTVIGIAKCHYRLNGSKKINAYNLASLTGMNFIRENRFAIKYFEKWLQGTKTLAEECGIDVLDLFYWENRIGNWSAMALLEFDLVHESFVPYNCRSLLTTLLSVKEDYRKPPDYILNKKLIERLWPEVLTEPINPHKT